MMSPLSVDHASLDRSFTHMSVNESIRASARRVVHGLSPTRIYLNHVERKFYRSVIGSGRALIFDIGANCGNKATIFKRLASRVVCAEPGHEALTALRRRFRNDPHVYVVGKG